MRRMQKTAAEKHEAYVEKESQVWEVFFQRLQTVRTCAEALNLHSLAVPEGSPGRKFYSNLGFFLCTFTAPNGASSAELKEYLRLIACFDEEGRLVPDARKEFEEAMELAIKAKPAW